MTVNSIEPVVTDSNRLIFTVAGNGGTGELDVDSNTLTNEDTPFQRDIFAMKRMPLIDVEFANVVDDTSCVQDITISFKGYQGYPKSFKRYKYFIGGRY